MTQNQIDLDVALNQKLDLFCPPDNMGLSQRLFDAIMLEKATHLFVVFLRRSFAVSLLCLMCGFYLGWQEASVSYQNTASYFFDMLSDPLNTMEL